MATKKSSPKKKATKQNTMVKIAETVGQIVGELSVKKDQLSTIASNAIETVKSTLHEITAPRKKALKKTVKPGLKKAAKNIEVSTNAAATKIKKTPAAKKKEVAKAGKKVAIVKKAIKKTVKKK